MWRVFFDYPRNCWATQEGLFSIELYSYVLIYGWLWCRMKFNSSYVFGPRILEKVTENGPSLWAILLFVCNTIPRDVLTASILQCAGHAAWLVETNACMIFARKSRKTANCTPSKGWKANNKNYCGEIFFKYATWVWVEPTDGLLC
jgi:hypothetical protein